MISYKMFITEHENSLWVPMIPTDSKRNSSGWWSYNTGETGRMYARKDAIRYANYVRREKYKKGTDFDIEDYT